MHRIIRTTALALMLGVLAIVVPDATRAAPLVTITKVEHAQGVDVTPGTVWILAVGSDARPRQDPNRTRGDALQLVGINFRTGSAAVVGIPRDFWVPIAGHGSSRVNAALTFGGPALLGRTVGNLMGVEPDYVMVASFSALANMVTDLGGITVDNPRAFGDAHLGPARGWPKGKVRLNGMRAVEFARVRKSLPGGDFDRSLNQQRVMRGIHRAIVAKAGRPGVIEGGVMSLLKYMRFRGMSPAEAFRIAQGIAQVSPARVTGCVLSGRGTSIGGASVIIPNYAQAHRLGNLARRDATLEHC